MRKLDRMLANSPQCLGDYSYLTNVWNDLTQKKTVWDELDKFQDKICVCLLYTSPSPRDRG